MRSVFIAMLMSLSVSDSALATGEPWFVIEPDTHSCLRTVQAFDGANSPAEIAKFFARAGLHYQIKMEEGSASLLSTDEGRDNAIVLYKNISVCNTLARLRWEQR